MSKLSANHPECKNMYNQRCVRRHVSEIKLKRTDTTLDLSQKATDQAVSSRFKNRAVLRLTEMLKKREEVCSGGRPFLSWRSSAKPLASLHNQRGSPLASGASGDTFADVPPHRT